MFAEEEGVEEEAVSPELHAFGGLSVPGVVRRGVGRHQRGGQPCRAGRTRGAQCPQGQAVPQQRMVNGRQPLRAGPPLRGEHPRHPVGERRSGDVVDGDPARDAVPEAPPHLARVVGEPLSGVPDQPASRRVQPAGQVHVHQVHAGLHALGEQSVQDPVAAVERRAVPGTGALGLEGRPAEREPLRGGFRAGHLPDVRRPPFESRRSPHGRVRVVQAGRAPLSGAAPYKSVESRELTSIARIRHLYPRLLPWARHRRAPKGSRGHLAETSTPRPCGAAFFAPRRDPTIRDHRRIQETRQASGPS